MSSTTERLELLAWIGQDRRTYQEAIEVWKTHCPRHSLWEDAVADGLVDVVRNRARSYVVLSPAGESALRDAAS
jgi:hypothetical protein